MRLMGGFPLRAECGLVVLQALSHGCMARLRSAELANGVAQAPVVATMRPVAPPRRFVLNFVVNRRLQPGASSARRSSASSTAWRSRAASSIAS